MSPNLSIIVASHTKMFLPTFPSPSAVPMDAGHGALSSVLSIEDLPPIMVPSVALSIQQCFLQEMTNSSADLELAATDSTVLAQKQLNNS